MRRIGQERHPGQQPAETDFTMVAPRAAGFISHTTTPPYNGLGVHGRSAQPHHPSMMSILNHPARTTHRNASASSSSMSRSFNTLQVTTQFAVANSSSSMERYLPHHGQRVIQGGYSTSSPPPPNQNHHLSPYEYQTTTPNVAGNMIQPQNTYYHHPPAVFMPNQNIQHEVTTIPRTSNTVQLQNAPTSFRIAPQYDNTTNFSPPGVPAVESDFNSSSFCPPQVESTYNYPRHHGPWDQSQNSAHLSADPDFSGSDGQPKVLAALSPGDFESQSSINRSGHASRLSYPPIQPYGGRFHGGDPHQVSLHQTPHSPAEEGHRCQWLRGDNVPCKFVGSQDSLKDHIVSEHLSGPQDAPIVCRWIGCRYSRRGKPEVHTMRRDSAWRHVREMHLDVKFRKKVKAL